ARRQAGGVLDLCEEIVVRDEEAVDGAVEHDDLDPVVGLERRDDVIQLRNAFWTENIQGRVIQGNAPIERRTAVEKVAVPVLRTAQYRLLGASPARCMTVLIPPPGRWKSSGGRRTLAGWKRRRPAARPDALRGPCEAAGRCSRGRTRR